MTIRIDAEEIEQLMIYNAERRRGLLHNEVYNRDMVRLQERYDRQLAELAALTDDKPRSNGRRKTQPQRLLEEIIT